MADRRSRPRLPTLPCACASLRRAARAATQLYDEVIRPAGLRVTQVTLLQALALAPQMTQGQIGRVLALDSTTLSRTLRALEDQGWIRDAGGEDRRERRWEITTSGRAKLERVLPYWKRAQERLRAQLHEHDLDELMELLGRVAGAARAR